MTIPTAFYSTELFWSLVKWATIVTVTASFILWGRQEDKAVRKAAARLVLNPESRALIAILQAQNWRIWAILCLIIAILAANDIHRDKALLASDFFTPYIAKATEPTANSQEPAEVSGEKYDQILRKNRNSGVPFSNITEFNEQNSKREAYIDWLKERYESWLITYYYLDKCKKTGPGDYEVIRSALKSDLDSAHAGEAIEGNILLAASGSYQEMYSNIPCDDNHLHSTRSMYDANMLQVGKEAGGKALSK